LTRPGGFVSLGPVNAPFVFKLALSFLVGGLWVAAGLALAERRGPRLGGLIIGFPSTVLFALFFIAWTLSAGAAVQAAAVIPAVHGINCLYVLVAVSLLPRGLAAALSAGLGVWFALATVLVAAKFDGFLPGLFIYAGLLLLSYSIIGRMTAGWPRPERLPRSTPLVILGRGAFGGAIVVLAVVLAKAGGPLVGGVFAIFPAVFTAALVATYASRGPAFSAAVMRASLLGGTSVVVYAAVVRLTYPPLGLGFGTAVSAAAAIGSTVLIRALSPKRDRHAAPGPGGRPV